MHGPLEELTKDNLSKVRSNADALLQQAIHGAAAIVRSTVPDMPLLLAQSATSSAMLALATNLYVHGPDFQRQSVKGVQQWCTVLDMPLLLAQ